MEAESAKLIPSGGVRGWRSRREAGEVSPSGHGAWLRWEYENVIHGGGFSWPQSP